MKHILIMLLLISYPLIAISSSSQVEYQAIKNTASYKCIFPKSTSAICKNDKFETEEGDGLGNDYIHFDTIDVKQNKARIIGNRGSAEIKAFLTREGLTMLEETFSGNFIITTVFSYKVDDNKFLAVMSRHINMAPLPPIISQNYGYCESWN